MKRSKDLFLSAVTGCDGMVNIGYLVLFRSGRAAILVIAAMVVGSLVEMALSTPHVFNVQPLGVAIGSVMVSYGALLGGMAAFLWGDSKTAPAPAVVTETTVTQKETTK